MTPEEIAAKLTPAQVRALRLYDIGHQMTYEADCPHEDWLGLKYSHEYDALIQPTEDCKSSITPLGRAVLAAMDAKEPK